MTAPSARFHADAAVCAPVRSSDGPVRLVGQTCQTAIDGRRAVRTIGEWSERLQLTEPELQILWCLREATGQGVDQTTLATRMAFSPAQVSACVEKLRARGLISHHEAPGDRRRRLWQLSANGSDVLPKIAQAAGECLLAALTAEKRAGATVVSREAAA